MFPDGVPFPSFRDLIFPARLIARERILNYSDTFPVTVSAGGAGYLAGDTIGLSGGTGSSSVALLVGGVSAGSVTAATAYYGKGAYTVLPTNPVAQATTNGAGLGATFNLTFSPYYHYSWQEQAFDTGGQLFPAVSARAGDAFYNYAQEMNNVAVNVPAGSATIAVTGQPYTWMRLRCGPGGVMVFDFNAPGLGSESVQINSADSTTVTLLPILNVIGGTGISVGLNDNTVTQKTNLTISSSESVQINSSSATTVPLLPTMNYIEGTGINLNLSNDTATSKTELVITGGADSLGSTTPGSCSAFGTYALYGNLTTPSLSRLWFSLGSDTAGNCKWVAFCPCDSISISGGGSVTTTCCGSTTIPITLHATVAGGDCAGTYTMVYNAGTTSWETTSVVGGCTNSPKKAIALTCNPVGPVWNLIVNGSFIAGSVTATCTPFVVSSAPNLVPELVTEGCCLIAGTVTITP